MLVRLLIIISIFVPATSFAKKVKYRKTQNVSFDGSDIDGVARTPDGAYLHQKRGVKFLPLYKVRKKFDEKIKSSDDYLR